MADDCPPTRLHRDPHLVPLEPQIRDLAVLRDLFYFRWATAPTLALTASWANGGNGHAYFPKRLTQLWRAGYVERFAGSTRYLHGSRHLVYTVGDGKASAAARTGRHPLMIPEDPWREVLAQAAPARARTRAALLAAGLAPPEIDRVLHNNTEVAMKYYAGETSGVRHHVLTSALVALLWFSARSHGWPVDDIQPDGVADLSFREPEPHRYRDLMTRDGTVPIRPDCMFTIAGHSFAVEAETGSASIAKLRLKLRRYVRGFDVIDFILGRVIFHCATATHAQLTSAAIADTVPPLFQRRFLTSQASALVTLPERDAATTLTMPLFGQATGRAVALFAV